MNNIVIIISIISIPWYSLYGQVELYEGYFLFTPHLSGIESITYLMDTDSSLVNQWEHDYGPGNIAVGTQLQTQDEIHLS